MPIIRVKFIWKTPQDWLTFNQVFWKKPWRYPSPWDTFFVTEKYFLERILEQWWTEFFEVIDSNFEQTKLSENANTIALFWVWTAIIALLVSIFINFC